MSTGIVSSPAVLESLQDRLREAEDNLTVPLRDAHQQWMQRAQERERSGKFGSAEQSLPVSVGQVVAIAAAVAAGAAVYKMLSSPAPSPEVTSSAAEGGLSVMASQSLEHRERSRNHSHDQDQPKGAEAKLPQVSAR
jgi:hypothetical protein